MFIAKVPVNISAVDNPRPRYGWGTMCSSLTTGDGTLLACQAYAATAIATNPSHNHDCTLSESTANRVATVMTPMSTIPLRSSRADDSP